MEGRSGDEPLRVRLEGYAPLAWILVAFHGGAAAAVAVADLGTAVRCVAWLFLGLGLWRGLAHHAWRSAPGAVTELVRRRDSGWRLHTRDGGWLDARLTPGSLVHPQVCMLGFRVGALGLRHVILVPGAVEAASLRRLRVVLAGAVQPAPAVADGSRSRVDGG